MYRANKRDRLKNSLDTVIWALPAIVFVLLISSVFFTWLSSENVMIELTSEENFYRLLLNMLTALVISALLAIALVNIRKRVRTYSELKASEERYRRLTENARDMVFHIDLPSGRCRYVNPAVFELTGYSADTFCSDTSLAAKLIDPQWCSYCQTAVKNMLNGNMEPFYEFRVIHKSGQKRWIHLRPALIKDDKMRPVALEGIATDITQTKESVTERERLIDELESINAELERYAYTISHELKTPLITIRGFLGYLEKEAVDGDISTLHNDLMLIQNATDTMQRLLESLIELSRVGRAPEEPRDTPFSQIVTDALESFWPLINARSIKIETAANMPIVRGHKSELVELVKNLVENAIKFMGDQKEPRIKISSENITADSWAVFTIEDNGIGMEPKHLNRIFGIFTKLDPASEGAGVGLALAHRIVTFHGGWIKAQSAGRGKGMALKFKLPVK